MFLVGVFKESFEKTTPVPLGQIAAHCTDCTSLYLPVQGGKPTRKESQSTGNELLLELPSSNQTWQWKTYLCDFPIQTSIYMEFSKPTMFDYRRQYMILMPLCLGPKPPWDLLGSLMSAWLQSLKIS